MRGFTLVELAVVMIIVSLLLGGVILSLTAQQDIRQTTAAQQQLAEAREAVLGFAMVSGRLPCPAKPDVASGVVGAGSEDCSLSMGVVPWAALGLAETDPWGRRLTYRVTSSFRDLISANTVTPPGSCGTLPAFSSFALCSEGNITITDGVIDIATKVPAVIVSHGRNGRGAYLPTGTQVAGAAGDEAENADNDGIFVSHTPTPTPAEFDDLVVWTPLAITLSRMVAAGKLP